MKEPVRLERKEGAGKAGCPRHPRPRTPLRVRVKRNATGPDRTAASLRNGVNGLLRALPGDRALVATVALAHGLPPCESSTPLRSARTTRLGRPRAIVTATSTGHCRSLSEDVLRRSSARRLVRLRTRPAHEPAHCEEDLRARRSRVHRIPSRVCDDRETPSHGTERIASNPESI